MVRAGGGGGGGGGRVAEGGELSMRESSIYQSYS